MKVAHYRLDATDHYGMVVDDGVARLPLSPNPSSAELMTFLDDDAKTPPTGEVTPWSSIQLLPPITNPSKIVCVGLNYRRHIEEAGHEIPELPTLFLRFADTLVAHQGDLIRPPQSDELDYEGELAVIIGREGSNVPRESAGEIIAGYACFNDGSVRDWQHHTSQWVPGKNFAATAGFGPWMVTSDEMGELGTQTMSTRVNGEERQRTELADMVFTVPELVSYISRFTTLSPGDVIATGTPSGVGAFSTPTRYLKPGDIVEVEIDGIGVLRNGVSGS